MMQKFFVFLMAFFLTSCASAPPDRYRSSSFYNDQTPTFYYSQLTEHFDNSAFSSAISIGEKQRVFNPDVKKIHWLGGVENHEKPYDISATWYDPEGRIVFSEECHRQSTLTYQSTLNVPKFMVNGRIPAGQWRVEITDRKGELIELDRFYIGAPLPVSDEDIAKVWTNPDYDLSQASGIILSYDVNISVDENFMLKRRVYKKIKVLSDEDRTLAEVFEPFIERHEMPRIGFAHTILPDGQIIRQKEQLIGTMRQAPPVYTSAQALVMTMPSIQKDAILEYEIIFNGTEPLADGLFYDEMLLADRIPAAVVKYAVAVPMGMKLKYLNRNHDVEPQVTESPETGQRIYSWTIKNIAPVMVEPNMPSYRDVGPSIIVSTTDTWEPVAAWWRELTRLKYETTDVMDRLTLELKQGAASPEEIINRIYEYVKTSIRYVGFDFGWTVYEPAPARGVFRNKYGDCKNQAVLLKAMLNRAGIRADIGLVRTRQRGSVSSGITGAGEFNHAIVVAYEGDKRRFLDSTGSWFRDDILPPHDEGADILIIKDDGVELTKIPWADASKNGGTMDIRFDLDDQFNASGVLEMEYSGSSDGMLKSLLERVPEDKSKNFVQLLLDRLYPSARLINYEILHKNDSAQNLKIRINFELKNWLIKAGDKYVLRLRGGGVATPEYITKDRIYPVYMDSVGFMKTSVTLNLPKSLRVIEMPDPQSLDNDLLTFRMKYSQKDGAVYMEDYITDKKVNVSRDEYASFADAYEQYAEAVQQAVILGPSGAR